MQFLIIAKDGTDSEAPARRQAARPAHLDNIVKFKALGKLLYAGAFLNDAGVMIGSAVIAEFSSEEALRTEWLESEPYVTENVWKEIDIKPFSVASMFK